MMLTIVREVSPNIDDLGHRIRILTMQIKVNRLPDYLQPDNLFLGKYLIKDVVSYNTIYEKNLLKSENVFVE
jgi:hypothetical protein